MFSIAAINDTDSKNQWEPLAPTKEAQEFHLSQIYHEGLLKLQEKEYGKACELLETVLKDPLLPNGQVDNSGSDAHLLQLRFLALKNLAAAFLQQGSHYYEAALRCYLQAVEIDSKDSVVWNQLGTLSCSMGLLAISRWAFEQGLLCSPNNWNCMEKLLEVLIAIGDEVACLSVSELILRHWPSHSRALHVKKTIEESEPIPFAPRGIDKLEPKHVRLKFLDKRKTADDDLNESVASKKLKTSMEIHLPEASWTALASALLRILAPADECDSEQGVNESYRCADIRLNLHVPCSSENVNRFLEKRSMDNPSSGYMSCGDGSAEKGSISKERETAMCEEPHQERRSSRLESLRSRKPSKEELDFATGKDLAKAVVQFLGPFIVGETETKICSNNTSFPCTEVVTNPLNNESAEVVRFVRETSKNYGAYHMGHLLLEDIASKGILYQDAFGKILDLEKLTRKWGRERTPECNLFLAELYFDSGTQSSDSRRWSDSMSEASYHLCKVIESVALDYPFYNNDIAGDDNCTRRDGSQSNSPIDYMLSNKRSFWARFFWLSGKLSALNGDKEKAQKEFGISLSLLTTKDNVQSSLGSISLPHCKIMNELTVDKILREINLLEVDFLLKETVNEMIEKELYSECITLLAPLLFCAEDAHLGVSCVVGNEDEGITSIELSALDVLIKACQKSTTMDIEVYLKCHRRKLQILLAAAGVEDCFDSQRSFERSKFNALAASVSEMNESSSMTLHRLISEEVKAISQFASQMKTFSNSYGSSNDLAVLVRIIGNIQYSLLAVMCNIVSLDLSKKSFGLGVMNDNERRQRCCFIDAATAFFKLQHLNPNLPVKTHIDLITAIHELLAEYGLCCAGGDGEEEGTFLKLAIKHLLSLDMRLKSDSFNKGLEIAQCDDKVSQDHGKETECDPELEKLKVEACKFKGAEKDENQRMTNDDSSHKDPGEDGGSDISAGGSSIGMLCKGEERGCQVVECEKEPTEDEKEEVEVGIDSALNQCFYCLYGLHLRSDSSYEDDLATHRNTSRGDYQTKEQCADVFQYILPYAMASSRTRLVKLRRVLRSIRKHFPQPPDEILAGNVIDKFLDDPDLCENKLSEEAGSDGFLDVILKVIYPDASVKQHTASTESSEPFLQVYRNLYYLLAQSEEMSATDKWAGFVLTKEGEDFVQQNANLLKYDLLYNPLRFESWERLANIYDEEVDLLLNDGSKQINVTGWRKNATLHQRVDASRRRSRRCLLMTLALAKTAAQQGEIHELLALVYYDGLQNVVPIYDQKSIIPSKDATWMTFCQNSMEHFKKAFAQKEEWSYAYYMGKLSEKLKCSHETSFAYYDNAITLNPSAVDPFYRMHASRLKLLCACGKNNEEALKVVAAYSFSQSTKETVLSIFHEINAETSQLGMDFEDKNSETKIGNIQKVQTLLKDLWHMLYKDCLSALEICVEGDLKHFHKARYMLAQGLYKRNDSGDLEKAKDELSFCFKSSRSSFTINMWEIDGMVKKGRRKAPGLSGNKKVLEVNLPESSRKFITCIRKYILFYMKLLDETGDISTLDRAYISLRADKRFSLCLEDLVPIALGRYIKALISSIHQAEISNGNDANSLEHLEKLFFLFMEQTNVWSEICNLREVRCPELSESSLYGSLYKYIQILERNVRLETLEGINEKMRKRLKNPKLSNSNCAKVYKHVSVAWCRSLLTSLALITPLELKLSSEIQVPSLFGGPGNSLLCVDLQTDEYWGSSFEDPTHLKNLKTQWNHILSKIKDVIIKRVSEENLDTATMLLRSAYNFYRDASCALLPSGIKLFVFPAQLSTEMHIQPRMEILEMNTPKKLLLWAYTLLHGHCNTNISAIIKCCEETVKSKMKKGSGTSSIPPSASMPNAATSQTGIVKDAVGSCNEQETVASATTGNVEYVPTGETNAPEHFDSSKPGAGGNCYVAASLLHGAETKGHLTSDASLEDQTVSRSSESISQVEKGLSATPLLVHCTSADSEKNNVDERGADYARG